MSSPWLGEIESWTLELRLRVAAIPAALGVGALFRSSATGHMLQRTFLSMMVHELGHAVTAWLCGLAALPTVWRTTIPETRGVWLPLLVVVAGAAALALGIRARRPVVAAAGGALAAIELLGALALPLRRAHELIVFGGDGGAIVLGAALMATFAFGRDTQLYRGWLRWGFLVIGAAAFVDATGTWWDGRADASAIPFGEIEGVGLSDPSQLTEVYGWSTSTLVDRYLMLAAACLAGLAVAWAWGVGDARRELDRARAAARGDHSTT